MRFCALILAALAAATLNWSAPGPSAPAKNAEQRMAHISIQTIGKGSPVVLIPGLSTPRAVWDGIASELAKSHQVMLVQVNGFAGDDPAANLQPGMLDGIVTDLHSYLAGHRLKSVHVIGHSMGGLVGLELAKSQPADVKRLMVVDALPFVGVIFVPDATVAQLEPQAKAMRDQMAASYGKPNSSAERTAATMALTPAAQAKVAEWIARADPRVAGQAMYEDLSTDLRPDVAKIEIPITLVYPTGAGPDPQKTLAFYQHEYAGAKVRLVGIAEAGHFVMLDQPEKFAAAVAEFVK